MLLSKPVDIIDISGTSKFIKLILKEGVVLYGDYQENIDAEYEP